MKIKTIFIDGFGEKNEKLFSLDKPISIFKGSNEAGKTTVLEFIRTILFGFDKRKARKSEWFKPLKGGKHGGYIVVEKNDGSLFKIQRYQDKRENISVLDGQGRDLGDQILQQILGGVDRKAFEQKYAFGIYDLGDTNDFDVNQKLYDAGLGAELGATLTEFEKDKKELFELGKGTKNKFVQDSIILDGIENQIQEIILKSKDYSSHQDRKTHLLKEEVATGKKIQELKQLQDKKTKLFRAFPDWKDLRIFKYKMEQLNQYKNFPDDAKDKLNEIENKINVVSEHFEKSNLKFLKNQKDYDELSVNQEILDDEDKIIALRNDLKEFESLLVQLSEKKKYLEVNSNQLQEKIQELSNDWAEKDLISFDSSLSISEEVKRFAKNVEFSRNNLQESTRKYSVFIQVAALSIAGLGMFFEDVFERFLSISLGAIGILMWNFWISKKSIKQKTNFNQIELNTKWEEFKTKYHFPLPMSPGGALKFLEKVKEAKTIQKILNPTRESVNEDQLKILDFINRVDFLATKHGLKSHVNHEEEYIGLAKIVINLLNEEKEMVASKEKKKEFLSNSSVEKQEHESDLKNLNKNLENLLTKVGCTSRGEFQSYAESAEEFKKLQNLVNEKEEKIFKLSVEISKTVEDIHEEFYRFSPEEVEIELEDISKRLEELEEEKKELILEVGSINTMLAQIEENNKIQDLQLEKSFYMKNLQEYVLNWCQLRIAEKILRDVQKKYQEEKQPDVIKFAERYFKKITFGKYTKIYVNTQEENNPVKVLQGDALLKTPDILSGGTKDQLFLSMRLGEIMNNTKSSNIESLPVIFDDILVNSDKDRSDKIIEILSEVSQKTQVIYFTFNPVVAKSFAELGSECEIIEL